MTTATSTSSCGCRCGCTTPVGIRLAAPAVSPRISGLLRCARCLTQCTTPGVEGPGPDELQRGENLRRFDATVPAEFAGAASEDPVVTDRLARWGQHPGSSLLVTGPQGVGKTYLGYALCRGLVAGGAVAGSGMVHGHESEVLGRITFLPISDSEAQLRRLCDPRIVRVLYIDDLGRGRYLSEQRRLEVLEQVIDAFYRTRRTLVVTTNLVLSDLQAYLGAATLDRLAHICADGRGESLVTMTGPSRRAEARAQSRAAHAAGRGGS